MVFCGPRRNRVPPPVACLSSSLLDRRLRRERSLPHLVLRLWKTPCKRRGNYAYNLFLFIGLASFPQPWKGCGVRGGFWLTAAEYSCSTRSPSPVFRVGESTRQIR
jgi:hypothetical protein